MALQMFNVLEQEGSRPMVANDALDFEEQVALLRLAFFLGRSHSEISEETGLPLGTVKSRIRLAFGRLRKILETDPKIAIDDD